MRNYRKWGFLVVVGVTVIVLCRQPLSALRATFPEGESDCCARVADRVSLTVTRQFLLLKVIIPLVIS